VGTQGRALSANAQHALAVFRSDSLREARRTVFTDRYLLASTELNVLNVILSQER
jgi:hypothetical protein